MCFAAACSRISVMLSRLRSRIARARDRVVSGRRLFQEGPVRLRFVPHLTLMLLIAVTVAVCTGVALWYALGRPALSSPHPGPLATSNIFDGIKIALTVVG